MEFAAKLGPKTQLKINKTWELVRETDQGNILCVKNCKCSIVTHERRFAHDWEKIEALIFYFGCEKDEKKCESTREERMENSREQLNETL